MSEVLCPETLIYSMRRLPLYELVALSDAVYSRYANKTSGVKHEILDITAGYHYRPFQLFSACLDIFDMLIMRVKAKDIRSCVCESMLCFSDSTAL